VRGCLLIVSASFVIAGSIPYKAVTDNERIRIRTLSPCTLAFLPRFVRLLIKPVVQLFYLLFTLLFAVGKHHFILVQVTCHMTWVLFAHALLMTLCCMVDLTESAFDSYPVTCKDSVSASMLKIYNRLA